MNKDKKAQAAMEFLMTYGWMILVSLAAIGALAYFGVLSPEKQLPEICTLSPGLGCIGFTYMGGDVQVVIQNSLGFDMHDVVVSVEGEGCNGIDDSNPILSNFENKKYSISCPGLSGKFLGDLYVRYKNPDTGLEHTEDGRILMKIVDAEIQSSGDGNEDDSEGDNESPEYQFSAWRYDKEDHTAKEDITSELGSQDGNTERINMNNDILHLEFDSEISDGDIIKLYVDSCSQGGVINVLEEGLGPVAGTGSCSAGYTGWVSIVLDTILSSNKWDVSSDDTHVDYDYVEYS